MSPIRKPTTNKQYLYFLLVAAMKNARKSHFAQVCKLKKIIMHSNKVTPYWIIFTLYRFSCKRTHQLRADFLTLWSGFLLCMQASCGSVLWCNRKFAHSQKPDAVIENGAKEAWLNGERERESEKSDVFTI